MKEVSAIVISASSDIGASMCRTWRSRGWTVYGTYRTPSAAVDELRAIGVRLVECDMQSVNSVQEACAELRQLCPSWDVLVLCPGTLQPVGLFAECCFDEWEASIKTNFTGTLRVVHSLLPARRHSDGLGPCVLFFAGGGTNSAPVRFSAYTVSKIALIKMTELLDAEIPDTRFAILGPGWVRTKIHEETLHSGGRAGHALTETRRRLAADDMTPMERVVACCDWVIESPGDVVGGRNFSVVHDPWGTAELSRKLVEDSGWFKLRRNGNVSHMNGISEQGDRHL